MVLISTRITLPIELIMYQCKLRPGRVTYVLCLSLVFTFFDVFQVYTVPDLTKGTQFFQHKLFKSKNHEMLLI